MRQIITAFGLFAAMALLGFFGGVPAALAGKCGSIQSTECDPPPHITYRGTGKAQPKLKPIVCVPADMVRRMTPPNGDFWFTYYLRYPGGSTEDMPPVIRTACVTRQWVVAGTKIGFWVDCEGYRWWLESAPITSSGRYTMRLIKKKRI